jgi:hypothetical protein
VRLELRKVRRLADERGLTLSGVLRRARVSRNAFYHLARQESVVPRSIRAVATVLGVPASAVLEEAAPPQARAKDLLSEARAIHRRYPESSFENIWHTLWLPGHSWPLPCSQLAEHGHRWPTSGLC